MRQACLVVNRRPGRGSGGPGPGTGMVGTGAVECRPRRLARRDPVPGLRQRLLRGDGSRQRLPDHHARRTGAHRRDERGDGRYPARERPPARLRSGRNRVHVHHAPPQRSLRRSTPDSGDFGRHDRHVGSGLGIPGAARGQRGPLVLPVVHQRRTAPGPRRRGRRCHPGRRLRLQVLRHARAHAGIALDGVHRLGRRSALPRPEAGQPRRYRTFQSGTRRTSRASSGSARSGTGTWCSRTTRSWYPATCSGG